MNRSFWLALALLAAPIGDAAGQTPFPLPPDAGRPLDPKTGLPSQTAEPPLATSSPAAPAPPVVPAAGQADGPARPDRLPEPVRPAPLPVGGGAEPPAPAVGVHVRVPAVVAAGQEVTYRIVVDNPSRAPAHHVTVKNPLPAGAKFVKADPAPTAEQPELQWKLGTLGPGQRKEIMLVLMPGDGDEVRNTARVQFEHGQTVATRIARPTAQLSHGAPGQAAVDEVLTARLEVFNGGTVPDKDVKVTEALPDGLTFDGEPARDQPPSEGTAAQRTWSLGTLAPGQRRTIAYKVKVTKPGAHQVKTTATHAGGALAEASWIVNAAVPKLTLTVTGPAKCYVQQQARYEVTVTNAGTMPLNNVVVTDTLPANAVQVKATTGGEVLRAGQVQWVVPTLKPGESRALAVTCRVGTPGRGTNRVSAAADRVPAQTDETPTEFMGMPSLHLEATGTPVAKVGGEVVYTVNVSNNGTADATNVQVSVNYPVARAALARVEPEKVGSQPHDTGLTFERINLAPNKGYTYRLVFKANAAGEAHFRFKLEADALKQGGPIEADKSTEIVNDPAAGSGARSASKE